MIAPIYCHTAFGIQKQYDKKFYVNICFLFIFVAQLCDVVDESYVEYKKTGPSDVVLCHEVRSKVKEECCSRQP